MNTSCDEILPLLAGQTSGLLDGDERSMLEEHLLGCEDCPAFAKELEATLASLPIEPREPPAALWEKIERAAREEREGRGPATALRILLACTFCKGTLDRTEALYCAACLAPHHKDCLETHGRCAAAGCGETRTVAPRERATPRRPRRFAALVVGALVAAGSAAAWSAARSRATGATAPDSRDALVLAGESDAPIPAYPWAPPQCDVTKKLTSQKVTFNFSATPLSEVVQFLQDFTGLNLIVHRAVDQEQVRVDLRLRDVVAWNALNIIVEQAGLAFEVRDEDVIIAPRDKLAAENAWPKPFDISGLFDAGTTDDSDEIVRRLATQKVTLNFDDTPLLDALDAMNDLTTLNVVLATDAKQLVERDQLKVKLRVKDVTAQNAFNLILACSDDLVHEVRNGVVLVRLRDRQAETASLAAKRVTLDVRGATPRDLVGALAAQGVEAYLSPAAWSSRGTFSLAIRDAPLGEALSVIRAATSLRARIVARPTGQQVVVLEGRVASAAAALTRALPGFTGVATEVRVLREHLVEDLVRRRTLRAAVDAPAEDLYFRERCVELTASTIAYQLDRVERIREAAARVPSIERALAKIAKERPKLRADRAAASEAGEAEIAAISSRIEAKADASADEREKLRNDLVSARRELTIRLAKLDLDLGRGENREKDLEREQERAGRALATLRQLERGDRLSEAEGD